MEGVGGREGERQERDEGRRKKGEGIEEGQHMHVCV